MMYVEDYLENLVGLSGDSNQYCLEKNDVRFLSSIARQVFKGIGLTDRQHSSVKEKILNYKSQFKSFNEEDLDNLRIPLRQIDRSQYVKISKCPENFVNGRNDVSYIKIRFPFSKKIILIVERLKMLIAKFPNTDYYHQQGSHEHYFKLSEKSTYHIVNEFKEKQFEIDNELLEYYDQVKEIADNPQLYIPGVYNFELRNISQKTVEALTNDLGEVNSNTLALYKDRSLLYGLQHFDNDDVLSSVQNLSLLTQKIINRKSNLIFVNKNNWSLNSVIDSISELNRFPLLVLLDEDSALDQLSEMHQHLRNIISNHEVSVLFRLDNVAPEQIAFNEYVKDNKLNNSIDNNIKVVYISKSKLPKPFVKSDWKPKCVLSLSSVRSVSKTDIFEQECDLSIHHDVQMSPFYEHRNRREGKIEKI